jgi:teichuronic acid biosynthesis glycosyltransferase TuaC
MLRLLLISAIFPNAERPGLGASIAEQAARLSRTQPGFELRVIAPAPIAPEPEPLVARMFRVMMAAKPPTVAEAPVERGRWDGIDVVRPRYRLAEHAGWGEHLHLIHAACARAMDSLDGGWQAPDLLYAPSLFPCGPAVAGLARRLARPYAIGCRGPDLALATGNAEARRATLAALAGASIVVAGSEELRRTLAELGVPAEKIRLILPGIDLALFGAAKAAGELKAALGVSGPILHCAGAGTEAGRAHLLGALAQLPDAVLVVTGDSAAADRLLLRARARGLGDRVRHVPAATAEERACLLATSDLTVSPEPSPGISERWIESLACGTPLVLAAGGAAREVVAGPHAGRVVRETSAGGLAEAIRIVLDYPPRRELVRSAAQRFSLDRNVAELGTQLGALAKG